MEGSLPLPSESRKLSLLTANKTEKAGAILNRLAAKLFCLTLLALFPSVLTVGAAMVFEAAVVDSRKHVDETCKNSISEAEEQTVPAP